MKDRNYNSETLISSLLEENKKLKEENLELRKIWWMYHGDHYGALYGDDGELQCSKCMIDFKRDSMDEIRDKISKVNKDILDLWNSIGENK